MKCPTNNSDRPDVAPLQEKRYEWRIWRYEWRIKNGEHLDPKCCVGYNNAAFLISKVLRQIMSNPEKKCQPRRFRSRSRGDSQKYILEIGVCQKDIDVLKRVYGLFSKVATNCHDMAQLKNFEKMFDQISSKFLQVRKSSITNFFFYCKENVENSNDLVFFQAKCGDLNVTQQMIDKLKKHQIEVVESHNTFCLYAKSVSVAFRLLEEENWIGHYES